MIERDYLMRMVQQLAAVITRVFNLKKQEKYDEARETIREAYGELFGLNRTLLEALNAESLAQLIRDQEKLKAIARLFQEEASLYLLQGDETLAKSKHRRAFELYLEASSSNGSRDPEIMEAIRALAAQIDLGDLTERYAVILKKMGL